MSYYKESPYSTYGGADSMGGTPSTRVTSFSPEDGREKTFNAVKSTAGKFVNMHDPFVASSLKPKSDAKLSATATSFEPYGLGFGTLPTPKPLNTLPSKPTGPIPGTTQYLESIIAAEESSTNRPNGSSSSEVTQMGYFTTDSLVSRHLKVASFFREDVRDQVQKSIEKQNDSEYQPQSTSRLEMANNVVYLSFAHINDAIATYNAIRRDHDNLVVEFIQADDMHEIDSPLAKGKCSAFEGQVLLHVQYPLGINKPRFEEEIRALLATKNRSLYAWEKMSDAEVGTFALVAEFHDSSHAKLATQELHGKVVGVPPRATIISVQEHQPVPTKKTSFPQATPVATPTRYKGESTADLAKMLGQLNFGMAKAPEQMPFNTPGAPAPLTYPHPTSTGYGVPVGMSYAAGTMYSSSTMGMGMGMDMGMFNGMTPQSTFPTTGYSSFGTSSYSGQGPAPSLFAQQGLGRPMGYPSYNPEHAAYAYGAPPQTTTRFYGYSPRPQGPVRRQNAEKVPYHVAQHYRRNRSQSSGTHNVVDVDHIRLGVDVRTTVMLRNIPNKVTQEELKSYVDETSFGQYDFMYLRIDFSNDCNVGYAFINFTDPLHIVLFVTKRSGQRWDNFRSDKRAEVSYATIQGRDCLIQKFRNSSVMLEPETARPKLFYAFPDPMVGEEEPFPACDNHSKLTRSCQNAENVGLFAPSASQHLRDEQRRRRSQYDRGTTMAAQEEIGGDLRRAQTWIPYGAYH